MRIVQIKHNTTIVAGVVAGENIAIINGHHSTYDLAKMALAQKTPLQTLITDLGGDTKLNYDNALSSGIVVAPLHHPDPAHFLITGTGLSHLGSADARNKMHRSASTDETDSMKMFRWGVENGKPKDPHRQIGVQPEWFYKGDGAWVVAPNQPLDLPNYADDGGEEPEIAGLYIIDTDGTPYRIGFTLSNEYSDHIMEKKNYLYLAHSKLRQCSFGPEILLGDLPPNVQGTSTIYRNGEILWQKPFLSGEDNMSHSIKNLEHHHFKYDGFCRAGDIHAHFFGTATVSFADNLILEHGDIMEIVSPQFGKPLRNPLHKDTRPQNIITINSV